MKHEIIGRKKEIEKLEEILAAKEAEFLALYGRRRVGKTYLVRQFFKNKPCFFFEVTGLKDGSLKTQLELFSQAIADTFYQGKLKLEPPKRWLEALKLLDHHLQGIPANKKIILFFDELPWLATRKSDILQALDYYWNTRWSQDARAKLIVCGSAASWMLEKLIYAKGGLYNRITARIHLQPFSLKETQEYLKYRGIQLNENQILQLYMVMGGIPFYLKSIAKGLSAAQNINRICFQPEGLLLDEFNQLFSSLFGESEAHLEIIQAIARHRQGVSRNELLEKVKRSSSGGTFKTRLLELDKAGFVVGFTPYLHATKGTFYRIIDEYTLFYLYWIHPVRKRLLLDSTHYWESRSQTQPWKTWAGYAFEAVCFKHIPQICKALDIPAIPKEIGSWRWIPPKQSEKPGVQIDMLLDRADGIINICEIKHYDKKFAIDKAYAQQLQHKLETFKMQANTNKQLFLTMITTHGLTQNEYSRALVAREITLKDLFS